MNRPIDPDTGAPVVLPVYLVMNDSAYWIEPLPSGLDFLCAAPMLTDGTVGWDDECEVDPEACHPEDYDAIVSALRAMRPVLARQA